ncbi:MAG: FMN-binding protein, partial [Oscillibacter sp.]|nr:FMN-binding protein [Oscillibacter sp.]
MRRVFYIAGLAFLFVAAIALSVSAVGESAVILIDGAEQSGSVTISGGVHTVAARSDAEIVCVAVYENGQFKAASFSAPLEYDFPASGAEIALFCLDSQFRPLREAVRVQQGTAARKLAYSGESVCYDEWNDDEEREFDDYTVRLRVITENGTITEIRDIGGYEASGAATNDANAYYLGRAAAQLPARIIERQSADGVDAVSGATCASHAILRAVRAALESTPEPYDEEPGDGATPVPDGVYAGSAQCLTGYINYMVDVEVTVEGGLLTELRDCTLRTPMSSNDKILYNAAWRRLSGELANTSADSFQAVDALSGATVSSAGINAAVRNALTARSPAREQSGDVYAPEGISLYARVYPVATVRDGRIENIRIVPARDTDTERLEAFAAEITRRRSVAGLT